MGQIMQKKLRARILMDQKATSVADVAAVLTIQEEKAEKAAAQGGEAAGKKQRKPIPAINLSPESVIKRLLPF